MRTQPLSRKHSPFHWSCLFLNLSLLIAVLFFITPIYILIVTGFKNYQEVSMAHMWELPKSFSLDSFSNAWIGSAEEGYRGLSGNFLNSLMLVIPAALTSAFIGSINGYVLAKWKFKGSNLIFTLMLFGMFIPYQSILIPLVRSLQWITYFTLPLINWYSGSGCAAIAWMADLLDQRAYSGVWHDWRFNHGARDLWDTHCHPYLQKLLCRNFDRTD